MKALIVAHLTTTLLYGRVPKRLSDRIRKALLASVVKIITETVDYSLVKKMIDELKEEEAKAKENKAGAKNSKTSKADSDKGDATGGNTPEANSKDAKANDAAPKEVNPTTPTATEEEAKTEPVTNENPVITSAKLEADAIQPSGSVPKKKLAAGDSANGADKSQGELPLTTE